MALINKLKAVGDGFRTSRGTTQEYTLDEMAVLAAETVGGSAVIEPLTITENGEYTPPDGVDGYSPVTVNVAGGSSGGSPAVLTVGKKMYDTSNGENTYSMESFILLDIYPKTNGTVNVTYGGLTKTITDTSGATIPNPQSVFFGTLYGVTDDVETPESGTLTIEGDYRGFGNGVFTDNKSDACYNRCITGVDSLGDVEFIPDYAFAAAVDTAITIPTSVRLIGENAFHYNDSTNIFSRTFVLLSALPPCIGGDTAFFSVGSNKFIVPSGSADIYEKSLGWRDYASCFTEEEV